MRGLTTGILSGWQENAAEKTDFATLGASFKIAKGQAQTADLRLAGPLVRMTGAGTVDLPGKTLKFRVDPQLVASLEGQGGKTDLQGLGVPIMIAGPWAKPSIYPDIEGILKTRRRPMSSSIGWAAASSLCRVRARPEALPPSAA